MPTNVLKWSGVELIVRDLDDGSHPVLDRSPRIGTEALHGRQGCFERRAYTPSIFSHVHLRVSDLRETVRFYELVLGPLGISKYWDDGSLAEFGALSFSADGPASKNVHIAFAANSREGVEAFYDGGLSGGFRQNGRPGYRDRYAPDYFAAYLLDPDANNIEAVWRDVDRRPRL